MLFNQQVKQSLGEIITVNTTKLFHEHSKQTTDKYITDKNLKFHYSFSIDGDTDEVLTMRMHFIHKTNASKLVGQPMTTQSI